MSKKVDVYTLGQYGVNRVRSPIHVLDGELLTAQNATISLDKGQLALRKRDGMGKINSVAAAGTLLSITNIPLHVDPVAAFSTGAGSACVTYADRNWSAGAWSPSLGLFVIVGQTGTGDRVATSTNGSTWTLGTSAANVTWEDVCWSPELNLFAAIASTGTAATQIMTSPNGLTWTSRTAPAATTWKGICWSATLGVFQACASDSPGRSAQSSDGITWTLGTGMPDNLSWVRICWAAELSMFVACSSTASNSNCIATSPDGITWTIIDTVDGDKKEDVCFSPELGILVAVGDLTTPGAHYSYDGITWTSASFPTHFVASAVQWSPEIGLFLATGTTAANGLAVSSDGINWTNKTTNCGIGSTSITDVIWAPALGVFLMITASTTAELMS